MSTPEQAVAAVAPAPAPAPVPAPAAPDGRRAWTATAIRVGGVGLGLAFLWVAASRADLPLAWRALERADPVASVLVLLTALAFMWLKTLRWAYLLKPVVDVRFGLLQRLVYVGTAANILIPHSGELVRATQLARQSPDAVFSGTVLGTVAVERLLDFGALALFATALIVVDPSLSRWIWVAGSVSVAIVVAGGALVLAVLNAELRMKRVGTWLVRRLPARIGIRLHHHVYRGIEGLGTLREPRRLMVALALSVLQWAMVVLAIWLSFRAVGESVSLAASVAVFALTVIGLTLPSAPGQLGTTQLAFVAGLTFTGGATSEAFAASLVYGLWFVGATMLIGGVLWLGSPRRQSPSSPRGVRAVAVESRGPEARTGVGPMPAGLPGQAGAEGAGAVAPVGGPVSDGDRRERVDA